MPALPSEDTRSAILEAARTLLRRHGADKLTVVDIARALKMSHANVYRFFKGKAEILDAINEEWLSRVEAFVEEIAHRPGTATERLEAVVMELHLKRRQKFIEDPEIFETFRRLVDARPEIIARRREKILNVFHRLFKIGMATGEFRQMDCREAAVVLKDATTCFLHPLMIPTTFGEDTEGRARNVVRSILAGYTAAKPGSAATPPADVS